MPSDHAVVSTSRFFTYQRSLDRGLDPHQSDHHGRTRNSKERENSSHASCLRKSSVRASPESRRKQHPSRASPSAPRPISGATRVRGRGSCAPSFVSWQLERGGKQATARERQSRAPAQASVFVIHTSSRCISSSAEQPSLGHSKFSAVSWKRPAVIHCMIIEQSHKLSLRASCFFLFACLLGLNKKVISCNRGRD